jgi:hypothetical protein
MKSGGENDRVEGQGWGIYVPSKEIDYDAITRYFVGVMRKRSKMEREKKGGGK